MTRKPGDIRCGVDNIRRDRGEEEYTTGFGHERKRPKSVDEYASLASVPVGKNKHDVVTHGTIQVTRLGETTVETLNKEFLYFRRPPKLKAT